jgi:hypothetical protein
LEAFHKKIARLKFLDPACGCGNFLIVTYGELRELEFQILKMQYSHLAFAQGNLLENPLEQIILVNVEQFYGIEIEDFPCQVAIVGMWLIDHQMNTRVAEYFGIPFTRLPLTRSAAIVRGNALRVDWGGVLARGECCYVLGNPPFVGHQWRNAAQQEDMRIVHKGSDKFGKLDYVCCWYQKAIDYMAGTHIRAAFVSTNSIVQGESVAAMWKPFFEQGYEIVFAHTPFVWSNEASGKAAVHCVIIGFAPAGDVAVKRIYTGDGVIETGNINGYLLPAPNVFIQSRGRPLTPGMPEMSKGSQPTDGGHLILSPEERDEMIAQYPQAEKLIKRYMSGEDFINNILRYCLWLKDVVPMEYRSIKPIMQRLEKVAQMRRASPTASVRRDADTPMLFTQIRQPEGADYIVVPRVSSERRKYIPIGFMSADTITSDAVQIISNATLYHFGILTSCVHMAWACVVCGRLKSDYRYTPAVYNNFPWPDTTDEQRAAIESLAQAILDIRCAHPESSLADLYDHRAMLPELLKAHQTLDRAVMKLYGFGKDAGEAEIAAGLMERYRGMTGEGGN